MNSSVFSPLYVLLVLTLCVLASEWLARTPWLKKLGAALIVIILTAIVANLGLIPTRDHSIYDGVFDYVAPASIFLLLLDVNLRALKKVGIPMLALFLIGAAGTTLGVITATFFVRDGPAFEGLYSPIAGMFAGTYTGGSLNFNAVALHYGVMEEGIVFAGAIAVDNIITAVWMFFTLILPSIFGSSTVKSKQVQPAQRAKQEAVSPVNLAVLVSLTVFSLWFSEWLAAQFAAQGVQVPAILIITTLALIFAQFTSISSLPLKNRIGTWLVFLFLGTIGAFCDLSALGTAGQLALLLLIFALIIVFVHITLLILAAWIFKWEWELVSIASQANIGGSTTAMALAQSFGRHELVLPAIIIGSVGNAIGTYIGFLVAGFI